MPSMAHIPLTHFSCTFKLKTATTLGMTLPKVPTKYHNYFAAITFT